MQGEFSQKTVIVDNAIHEGVRGFSVYQEFLSNKGHNMANCEWMVHENPQMITN